LNQAQAVGEPICSVRHAAQPGGSRPLLRRQNWQHQAAGDGSRARPAWTADYDGDRLFRLLAGRAGPGVGGADRTLEWWAWEE
jgi:hypothetical protein